MDRDGLLDDPDYIANLPDHDRAQASGRNVYPFSLSVASHMSLQYAKLLGAGERIGGIGPQRYHAYPGSMNVEATASCDDDCEYSQLLGSAVDPHTLLPSTIEASESEPQTRPDMVKRVCSAALRLVARSRRRPPHHPS